MDPPTVSEYEEARKQKKKKQKKREATRHQRCAGRTQHQRCDRRPRLLTPTMWRKGDSHQRCGGWETHTNDVVDGRVALEALLLDVRSEFQLLNISSILETRSSRPTTDCGLRKERLKSGAACEWQLNIDMDRKSCYSYTGCCRSTVLSRSNTMRSRLSFPDQSRSP